MGRKPSKHQLELPFSLRREMHRKRWGIPGDVKHLLRVLDDFAGERGTCWPKLGTIADAMDSSLRTVQRAIKQAIELELLIVMRKTKSRRSNKYILRRAEMRSLAGMDTDTASEEVDCHPENAATQTPTWRLGSSSRDANLAPGFTIRDANLAPGFKILDANLASGFSSRDAKLAPGHNKEEAKDFIEATKKEKIPPSSSEAGWAEVEKELFEFGVGNFATAIAAARNASCSPSLVLEHIRFAASKPGAYTAGFLFWRILNLVPGQPASAGWPAESDEFRKAQARSARIARQATYVPDSAAIEVESGETLEARFGALLDSLSTVEINRLADSTLANTPLLQLFRRGRRDGLIRDALLKAIRRETDVSQLLQAANNIND